MRRLFLTAVLGMVGVTTAFAQTDIEALARRLLNSQGCRACHPFEAAGDFPAPDLSRIGSRLGAEQIRQQLVSPNQRHAAGRIGDFRHLDRAEIEALVSFLSRRK